MSETYTKKDFERSCKVSKRAGFKIVSSDLIAAYAAEFAKLRRERDQAAEKLAESLRDFLLHDAGVRKIDNGVVIRYQCVQCIGEPSKADEVQHLDDCYYENARKALAAYERSAHEGE